MDLLVLLSSWINVIVFMSEQAVDDPGRFVGLGRNGFRCTQASFEASEQSHQVF